MSLITISESIGCKGMTVARLVADELKLELYDDRRLEEAALISTREQNSVRAQIFHQIRGSTRTCVKCVGFCFDSCSL